MPVNANATIAVNSTHNDNWAKAKVPGKKAAENDYD
jgi:hypothetical protein